MAKFVPKIEMWPIDKIVPYTKNAKIHTPEQVARLAKQIEKTGWDVPIVVDKDGVIIKGHGRRLAAIHSKMKTAPVIVRSDMSKADANAARLADNRIAIGDYDTELLQAELSALSAQDYDLSSMGFDEKELSFLTIDPLDEFNTDAFDAPSDDDKSGAPEIETKISKALGFETVSGENLSIVKNFMAKIQFETGKTGEQAFVFWVNSVLSNP